MGILDLRILLGGREVMRIKGLQTYGNLEKYGADIGIQVATAQTTGHIEQSTRWRITGR